MENKKKFQLPGVGMRIVKSVIAVAVCFLINAMRGGAGMVFYSLLAALWCIQMYRSNTIKNAIQRTIGTCVGAAYGLVYLLLYSFVVSEFGGYNEWIEMLLVSICIFLVLYTTVVLNKNQASYFSCVVFLSIAINHAGDINPYLFVGNRFLDTMIGIVVGIAVNDVRLSIHPDRETLFVSGLDETLLDRHESLNRFSKVELNRMIEDGMKFTISTKRTPASLLEPMRDVKLKLPVIAMDGAVLYDINTHAYLKVYVISHDTSKKLMQEIMQAKVCWYANVIIDDTLLIYYEETNDAINDDMVNKLRISPYRNYVKRKLPENEEVVYFMLLDHTKRILQFYNRLIELGYMDELKIVTYPSRDYKGYSYIKIYNKNATKENMIQYLKQMTGVEECVTFGTIEGKYDVFVDENNANTVIRRLRRMYENSNK